MIDNSQNEINSLNNFEFKPAWEITRETNNHKKDNKKTKETKKRREKVTHSHRMNYKISPYLKQEILDAIKSKLKKDGITRSINSISKEIENKHLYEVTIYSLDKKRKFFKVKNDDEYSFDEDQIVNHLLYHKNLVKIEIIEKVKVSKEIKNVLLCNKTNAIFPPTSHNLFDNAIDYHLFKNKIDENREKYIKSLIASNKAEHIEELHRNDLHICVFYLPNNKKLSSISAIKKEIKENFDQQFFKESESAKIGAKEIFKNNLFKDIQTEIKSNTKKIIRSIELTILHVMQKSKYHVFSRNNLSYVSAYHPSGYTSKELNNQSKEIFDLISTHKNTDIKSIMSESQKLSTTKLNIMKEIKWLIQIGIVRLYESGKIEVIKHEKS